MNAYFSSEAVWSSSQMFHVTIFQDIHKMKMRTEEDKAKAYRCSKEHARSEVLEGACDKGEDCS